LAIRAGTGDKEAFTALVEATSAEIQAFVASRAACVSMIDEVVQATFVAAFESIGTYRPGGSPEAWLKGIARNRLHEVLRSWRRSRQQPIDPIALVAAAAEPEDEVFAGERYARLGACLERLPQAWRRLVEARYWTDTPVQEIAEQHGTSVGTVSQTLYRARGALLACLEAHG
jgi:RNA polymerase sigma-70 factor (ECF subfamily)